MPITLTQVMSMFLFYLLFSFLFYLLFFFFCFIFFFSFLFYLRRSQYSYSCFRKGMGISLEWCLLTSPITRSMGQPRFFISVIMFLEYSGVGIVIQGTLLSMDWCNISLKAPYSTYRVNTSVQTYPCNCLNLARNSIPISTFPEM